MLDSILQFEKGMTVKKLKDLIADWPETDGDGEPTQVYLSDAVGLSALAFEICTLNARCGDGKEWSDLLLSTKNGAM